MTDTMQNHAATMYTINAIAAIVRREGLHDYSRSDIAGAQVATLCGLTVTWDRNSTITLRGRDVDVTMDRASVAFAKGNHDILQGWHRVLAALDNAFIHRAV
jgi:hypothetical protein